MILLILTSISIMTLMPFLWVGESFVFYLFIAGLEFATLSIAVTLKHRYKKQLLDVLFVSIALHVAWSIIQYLSMLTANGVDFLWKIGYQYWYSPLFDLIEFCALLITIIELLVLFAPKIIRLGDDIIRRNSAFSIDSNWRYIDSKGAFYQARKNGFREVKR